MKKILLALALILTASFLFSSGYEVRAQFLHIKQFPEKAKNIVNRKDVHAQFIREVYDVVIINYWDKIDDEKLSTMFVLGAGQLGHPATVKTKNKEGVEEMINEIVKGMDDQKKKEFTTQLADMVLASLLPNSRSRLYTTKLEQELANAVQNIDTKTDLYQTLGVGKEASQQDVQQTFELKVNELKKEEATASAEKKEEVKQKIAEANRAYSALGTADKRNVYDKTGKEPTVGTRFVRPKVLYLPIKRISPQTFEEFQKEISRVDTKGQGDALIVDLRGNIGGSIDLLPYFLGPFIGLGQYGYEFYHQGEYIPNKTVVGWIPALAPYKNVVALTDEKTQSSAEVIAAAFKKYNVGIVVGTKTRGWGTVEKVFDLKTQIDLNEKYSIFLVHSITLRDDNQPIEGRGVDPVIDTTKGGWEKELLAYFHRTDMVEAIRELLN